MEKPVKGLIRHSGCPVIGKKHEYPLNLLEWGAGLK